MEILMAILMLLIPVFLWIVGFVLPAYKHSDEHGEVPERKKYKYGLLGLIIALTAFSILWQLNG